MNNMDSQKPVHTIVLDAGAIIKNEPPVSTLLNQCESLVTVPAIISEIKDTTTRARVQTTLLPFLTLRSPNPSSVKFVADFARRTGDGAVLSRPDVEIIALAYEIECERNGGDWRLRRAPGQKGLNGAPPAKVNSPEGDDQSPQSNPPTIPASEDEPTAASNGEELPADVAAVSETMENLEIDTGDEIPEAEQTGTKHDSALNSEDSHEASDAESDGWITPSNLKKKQAEDAGSSAIQSPEPKTMQVAVMTTDFAMQNVILQINLNLLSPSLNRVKHLKTFVLRCHACFQVTKDMTKQFCPRCGQSALTRVSCSTNANGEFKLHLKKNMQWNQRGNKYSIPKPVAGSSNGKVRGGGKDGWGNELILAEDQKEYQRAMQDEKRVKARDLMDEDYLPSILTGDRGRAGGRVKVGAGRNVNSKKR